jgi:hypothetical protein
MYIDAYSPQAKSFFGPIIFLFSAFFPGLALGQACAVVMKSKLFASSFAFPFHMEGALRSYGAMGIHIPIWV